MPRITDLAGRSPILTALAAQGIAWLLVVGLLRLWLAQGWDAPPTIVPLAAHGALAALIGHGLGLQRWWAPLQFFLPFALAGARDLDLPSWLYLLAFLTLALVYWNAAGERVPLYLSNKETWRALESLLPEGPVRFIDLGAGLGGTGLYLAARRPESRFTGVESAPLPFAFAWLRHRFFAPGNAQILFGSLWQQNLADYDVVYCFLSPAPMERLFAKARKEMKPGSLFISNSFTVPGQNPQDLRELTDRRGTKLLIWQI